MFKQLFFLPSAAVGNENKEKYYLFQKKKIKSIDFSHKMWNIGIISFFKIRYISPLNML